MNKILVFTALIVCVMYIIYTIKKKTVWEEDKTLYSNLFSLRAFIMALILSLLLLLILLKGYNLL